ncbi:hypothetical protein BSKO_00195 [Bryopsis sp. KO-2023]|nr:hypothetical protein BSKO_00195 [Bryopsis sp. KO-2023]
MIASGQLGENADVVIWDAERRIPIFRFQEHDHEVSQVAFSSDDRLLATVGNARDHKIFFLDTSTGKVVVGTGFRQENPTALAWSPVVSEIYTAAAAFDTEVCMWTINPQKGTVVASSVVKGSVRRSITCLVFSADGQWLFAGTKSGDVVTINVKRKSIQVVHNVCSLGVGDMILLKTGQLMVGGGDGTLQVFDMEDMRTDASAIQLRNTSISSLSTAPDSNDCTLIVGTTEGSLLRHLDSNSVVPLLETQRGPITAAAFSSTDQDTFATSSGAGTIAIWSKKARNLVHSALINMPTPGRKLVGRIAERDSGAATCVQVCDTRVISGWGDGHIRCHSLIDLNRSWLINNAHCLGGNSGVSALCLGVKCDVIFSGGVGGEIRVWDVASRGIAAHMKQHVGRVTGIVAFEDSAHVMSCGVDGTMKLWDIAHEKCLTTFTAKMGGVNSITLVPDQVQVVSVGKDRCITFWDIRCPQPQQVVQNAHSSEVTSSGMTKDGSIIRLWDFRTGSGISELVGHTSTVSSTQFSCAEDSLISTGQDGAILWWE